MEIRVFPQVEKILREESKEIREDVQDILEKIALNLPLGMPHVRPVKGLAAGVFEIRVKDRSGQFRIVYLKVKGSAIYLIHAFRKKTQAIPKKEMRTILRRIIEVNNEKD